jgi:dihydrofolate synthase/folylpolyglutamate synthase
VTQTAWIESLSPWPEEFGLARMHALLDALGHPERAFAAIHVVGTNGKSTAARTVEELLLREGIAAGAYLSPHVRGWSERIRVHGRETDFEAAVARVRGAAEELGATQFETLTAAAFAEFAAAGVEVAAVEAGLGGRLDATNVLAARVVLLTNVGLEHTDVLGHTVEEIAREKLAVVHPDTVAVLPDDTYAALVPHARVRYGGAREAVEELLGRAVDAEVAVSLPGRLEVHATEPLELWDGAHNADGARYLVERLPERDFVLVASILADKDVAAMLRELSRRASRLVATASTSSRALPSEELAARAEPFFGHVEPVADPVAALERGRELAGEDGAVLVTGSLYLLAELAAVRSSHLPWQASASE